MTAWPGRVLGDDAEYKVVHWTGCTVATDPKLPRSDAPELVTCPDCKAALRRVLGEKP